MTGPQVLGVPGAGARGPDRLARAGPRLVRSSWRPIPQWERAPESARRFVRYGASPRGAQALVLGAKVRALSEGRFNVSVDDLRALALPALRHRLILNFEGEAEGVDVDDLVGQIVEAAEAMSGSGKEVFLAVRERRRSMPGPTVLERLVADVARQIRLRRAEHYGLRGLFWGAVAAVVPLLLKELARPVGYAAAAVLLRRRRGWAGALWGVLLRLARRRGRPARRPRLRAAGARQHRARVGGAPRPDPARGGAGRRRDRARRAARRPAHHRAPHAARGPARAGPAAARARARGRAADPAPAGPAPRLLCLPRRGRGEGAEDRSGEHPAGGAQAGHPARPGAARRRAGARPEPAPRAAAGQSQPGDLSAVFKDTSLAAARPTSTASSRRATSGSGCSSTPTGCRICRATSPRASARWSSRRPRRCGAGSTRTEGLAAEAARAAERDGAAGPQGRRKGQGNWSGDAAEGMEALEGGQTDKAMEAMQRALDKMRAQDESAARRARA